jgi:hypothetical protein
MFPDGVCFCMDDDLAPITKLILQELMEPAPWKHYWFKRNIIINEKQSKVEGWLASNERP